LVKVLTEKLENGCTRTCEIDIEIEPHVINRMKERGGGLLARAIEYLWSGPIALSKNRQGFEISIPFKGRLAGDFDRGVFVVKTFLWPFWSKKEHYAYVRKTGIQYTVTVRSIRFPGFNEFSARYLRALYNRLKTL
jgi:hypothetical protein